LCLTVSLSAGWLWHSFAEFQFAAAARISLAGDPFSSNPDSTGRPAAAAEDRILNPDILAAAAGLLADRNVALSLDSPFDSVTDYLLDHTQIVLPENGDSDDVRLVCRANSPDEALQMVRVIVDACLSAAEASLPALPASRADETSAERKQLADAIVRQQLGIEAMTAGLQELRVAGQSQDDPVVLEAEYVAARRTADESHHRMDQARHELESQVPAEAVAARITSIPVRTRTLEQLNLLKLKDELVRQEGLRQKWSAIYGRNHPRMSEIRQKVESLQHQIGGISAGTSGDGAAGAEASPAAIVLSAFEAEAAELAAIEQKLEARRNAVRERLSEQQELETRLADARQELTFLHGEHDRLKRQNEGGRRDVQSRLPKVIEPPAAAASQSGPRTGLPMAVSCVAGMSLYLLILWQFRALPQAARSPGVDLPTVTLKPVSGPRREQFRSPAEEQLMRLKMLSAHVESGR
jgi:hypothetical protein